MFVFYTKITNNEKERFNMNKKLLAIPALLLAIGGGAAFSQSDFFVDAANNPSISAKQAKEIALQQLNGNIVDFEYDSDGRTPYYEIDIVKDNEKVEYHINAQTGAVTLTERETINKVVTQAVAPMKEEVKQVTEQVKQEVKQITEPVKQAAAQVTTAPVQATKANTNTQPKKVAQVISQEKAIQIALSKANGKVTDIELDKDDNHLVYEIEIRNGKMEYDFDIDAKTGAILKYEEDLDDDQYDDYDDDNDGDDDDFED